MKNKLKAVLGIFLPSIVMRAIEIFISVGCVVAAVASAIMESESSMIEDIEAFYIQLVSSMSFYSSYMVAYGAVSLLVFVLWYHRAFVKPNKEEKKRRLSDNALATVLGLLVLTVGLQHLSVYLMSAIGTLFPAFMLAYEELFETIGLTSDSYTVWVLLYSIIIAPFVEEIIFRGLTLSYAKRVMPFWAANVTQAMIFAVMHGNVIQGSYAFILALFLGALVHKSGRLIYGFILHIAFNIFGTLGSGLILVGDTAITVYLIIFGSMLAMYAGYSLICKHIPQEE